MEQTNLFDFCFKQYKITKPIRLIELFAGYGSQAMALQKLQREGLLEFEHHKVVEFDKYAIKSYNAIHNTEFETSDIRDIHSKDLDIVDQDKYDYIMTYSFPCQDLSKAGKQKGMARGGNTRSGLLWEVERILGECWRDKCLPQILLMENVPDVIGSKNYPDFMKWYASLEACGYQSYYKTLNAKNYGIPQNRNRCYMISILGNYNYKFPNEFELKKRLKDVLEENVDEKYYLSDKLLKCFTDMTDRNGFIRGKRFNPLTRESEIAYTITSSPGNRATDNFIVETICLNSKVDEKKPSLQDRVYDSEGIANADTTSFMPSILDGGLKIRKLTPREYGRLMGVNDEDITKMLKVNSNSQCYKQFGNSIVVDVLYYIFKQMI